MTSPRFAVQIGSASLMPEALALEVIEEAGGLGTQDLEFSGTVTVLEGK